MTNVSDDTFKRLQKIEADIVGALQAGPNEADRRGAPSASTDLA